MFEKTIEKMNILFKTFREESDKILEDGALFETESIKIHCKKGHVVIEGDVRSVRVNGVTEYRKETR